MPNITFVEDSKYHTLPRYFFTETPIDIMLYTSNLYAVEGQKGKLVLGLYEPSGTSAVGNTLILKYPDHDLVFTQQAVPDESGLELPMFAVGQFAVWVQGVFDGIASNPDLATDFVITLTDAATTFPKITLEARTEGDEFDLSYNDVLSTIPGFRSLGAGSTYQAGITAQRRGNYKVLAQVLNRLNNDLLGEDLLTPNDAGEALFRCGEYLRPAVPASIPWPPLTTGIHELSTDDVMSFYIRFAESYDGTTYMMFDSRYYIFLALAGGLNWFDYKRFNGLGVQYFNDTELSKRFLDWAPDQISAAPDQPVRLAYMLKGAGTYSIKRVVTFTDGTATTLSTSVTATDVCILQMYLGHDESGLSAVNPAKVVRQIDVSVYSDAPALISRVRTIVYDRAVYPESEFLLWRNSFGRYQTLWLNARRTDESNIEREEAEITLAYEATPETAQILTHSHIEKLKVKAATGWMSSDEADQLRDFMLSKEVYRIRRQDYLERVIITNQKVNHHDTDDTLIGIEVEYEPTHRNSLHSNASAYVES